MTNKDIGFLLVKTGNDPFTNTITDAITTFISKHPYNQYVLFTSYCDNPNLSRIPVLHLQQAKYFRGDLFIFDSMSIFLTLSFPNIRNRYYYAQDFPWMQSKDTNYKDIKSLLVGEAESNNLNIISKNKLIDDVYNLCWKPTLGISEKFTYEELTKII